MLDCASSDTTPVSTNDHTTLFDIKALNKDLVAVNLVSVSQAAIASAKFLVLQENVFTALMVHKKDNCLRGVFSILKFNAEEGYVCVASDVPDAKENVSMEDYDWLMMQLSTKAAPGSMSITAFPFHQIPLLLPEQAGFSFGYEQHDSVHWEILLDLAANLAFHHHNAAAVQPGGNITADVDADSPYLGVYRDQLGFCVLNPMRFVKVEISVAKILNALVNARVRDDLEILQSGGDHFSGLITYDCQVAGFRRVGFLRSILANEENTVLIIKSGYQYLGYAAYNSACGQLLCLYAESDDIGRTLLLRIAQMAQASVLVAFVAEKRDDDDLLGIPFTQKATVRRLHTISIPMHINWDKVYAVNCGMHIV